MKTIEHEVDPYARLLAEEQPEDVFADLAKNETHDYSASARKVDVNKIVLFSEKASRAIRKSGVGDTLAVGFWLILQKQLVASEQGMFSKFREATGHTKTQACRKMNVARRSAKRFAEDPRLFEWFVPEALKLLCEPKAPEAALDKAFELAAKRNLIDIRSAESILGQFGIAKSEPSPTSTPKSKISNRKPAVESVEPERATAEFEKVVSESIASKPIKPEVKTPYHSFAGTVVKLLVELKSPSTRPALEAIIADVKAFLGDLEARYAKLSQRNKQKKVG